MRKAISVMLAALLIAAAFPVSARISNETQIDTDGSDGYSGDYVVIYNPSESESQTMSTGNMAGLIETEVERSRAADTNEPRMIDVDPYMTELYRNADPTGFTPEPVRDSYEVGDTRLFLILNYSPGGMLMTFKVLAKGEHCYVWTPADSDPNYYALDTLDPDFADDAAAMFDEKYELMLTSFGEHSNGLYGDGRVSLMYYNIDDGWGPGTSGYIGGYFYALDLYTNGLPMINIDTYPGVYYETASGNIVNDVSRTYGTIVHEYQHLINFSVVGVADTWVNEMMSAAAEELCFPGSSIYPRIMSWTNNYYYNGEELDDRPTEVEYMAGNALHSGYSMYGWSNDLPMEDLLTLYSQVSLFAQYIFSRAGNTAFHQIMDGLANQSSFQELCPSVFGMTASEFVKNFRIALTANTAANEYGGLYSFSMQESYDPDDYYGVDNLYDLLCPVVFTGSSCNISGGGAICVKPVGGVYYPPEGANSGLVYIGVTRNTGDAPNPPAPMMGDVDGDGSISSADALVVLRASLGVVILTNEQFLAADVDGDGSVTSADALRILRISMEI